MTLRIFYLLLLFLSISSNLKAQWSVAFGPGLASYSGDVSVPDISHLRAAGNLEFWYQLTPNIYAKAGGSMYRIYAEDYNPKRNRDFRADNYEFYTGIILAASAEKAIMPFISASIGITKVDPEHNVTLDEINGESWLRSREWNLDGQPVSSPALIFPIGGGLRFRVSSTVSIVVDGALRFTNTDLLDGVSASLINTNEINEIARLYYENIRPDGIDDDVIANGNPAIGDVYGVFSVKLQFELGSPIRIRRSRSFNSRRGRGKVECPVIIPESN
ncbi:hypothetical protein [Chondrinema litorale]|uniref:hypothetical protein n=1 Tax=Chondrinema litorale TaxID=2994555 RepID=UPI002543A827|nr:hypothetical protein [Chondrinema litorale]UZR95111.1 hypothetical protein OQ292_04680 [Chondrinema litorale]